MLQIAIVEDDREQAALLETHIRRYDEEHRIGITVSVFYNVITFLEKYEAAFDIVYMDILMPMMNGLDASRLLREKDERVMLIFVTSMRQYAIRGYEVAASDFLVKPVAYPEFALKFSRALAKLQQTNRDLLLRTESGVVRIPLSQIRYVEVRGHHCVYHTAAGEYKQYRTMKSVEEELSGRDFARCNNYLLVHLPFVDKIEDLTVTVAGETLPISHPRKKAFTDAFWAYAETQRYD